MLGYYAKENQKNWDTNLQKILYAIRSAESEATNMSPFFINFGREMNLKGEGASNSDILQQEIQVRINE